MRFTISAALAASVALAGPALAQDATVEGPGISVTDSTVFHPSVGLAGGVDSNVFREETDPILAPILRVLADFDIASRSADRLGSGPRAQQKVRFRVGSRFTYQEFLTDNDAARAQRDVAISANADVRFFPESTFTFGISDSFTRDTRPRNFESSESLDRDVNHLRVDAGVQPGGRALYIGARYENVIDYFESSQSDFANRLQHTVGVDLGWQWLPITRFFFDGSLGFYGGLGDEAMAFKNDSNPLRLRAGVRSAITERTTLAGHVGFAKGFYEAGPDYAGMLAGVEFGYRYSPLGRATLSYEHDYNDSINANFYADHVFKLTFAQQIMRVLATASGGVRLRSYEGVPMSFGGSPDRDDFIAELNAGLRYLFQDRYAVTADYHFVVDETDYRGISGDDPSYQRHEALLGVRAAF